MWGGGPARLPYDSDTKGLIECRAAARVSRPSRSVFRFWRCAARGGCARRARGGKARVAGIVVDASGAPVPGATVEVLAAGDAPRRIETREDGRFEAAGLPPGEASVRASAPGFGKATAMSQRLDFAKVFVRCSLHCVRVVPSRARYCASPICFMNVWLSQNNDSSTITPSFQRATVHTAIWVSGA